ncbi:MAG TPA: 4Fe-4S binding protein [Firmicutes bacterium]|nr:4Fe-4S binding protein [Candidatus Fermentithermobacillaceae bacterium]
MVVSDSPYEIAVNRKWCKKCGLCIAFCPKDVLKSDDDGGPVVAAPSQCIGCLLCEMHCPDFAIIVRRRSEQ